MRKTLLGFMTFLMLTPVLTCVMAFCPLESAQAAEKAPPCHGTMDAQQAGHANTIMFALDCLDIDLFQNNMQASSALPDQFGEPVDFAWADLTSHYNLRRSSGHLIRGPPFEDTPPYIYNHDIYLTTQRLRL